MTRTGDESTTGQDETLSGARQTSGSKGATTSKQGQKKTLSQEEINKLISDAKAEEGRKWKPIETERNQLKTQVGELETRLEDVEQTVRNQAYDRAKDDPASLKTWEADQALIKRERTVRERENAATQRETQNRADEDAIERNKGIILVPKIAAKYKIDPSELEDLGITDEAALDKVAAKIAGKAAGGDDEGKGEGEDEGEDKETFEPTSAVSSKGAKTGKATESVEAAEQASMESIAADVAPDLKQ